MIALLGIGCIAISKMESDAELTPIVNLFQSEKLREGN